MWKRFFCAAARAIGVFWLSLSLAACAEVRSPDQPWVSGNFPEGYFVCRDASCDVDQFSETEYRNALLERFDAIDLAIDSQRLGYSQRNNRQGVLSWGQSYVFRSYFAYYAATGDVATMLRAARHVENVLAQRDDVTGFQDWAGRSRATWATTTSSSRPMAFVVTDGAIVAALAEFARLVLRDARLVDVPLPSGERLGVFAERVLDKVEETIAVHESEWDSVVGAYRIDSQATFHEHAGLVVPYNWEGAIGRALLAVWRVRPRPQYRSRILALAQRFRASWTRTGDTTITWRYWSELERTEDTLHAHLNVLWMNECWQADIAFTYSDLLAFARTFSRRIIRPNDRSFSYYVNGLGDNIPVTSALLWMPLATFDSRLYHSVWSFFRAATAAPTNSTSAFNGTSVLELLGLAQMLEYRERVLGR
jgi:hypothetical protein